MVYPPSKLNYYLIFMDLFKYRSKWIEFFVIIVGFILYFQMIAFVELSKAHLNVCQSEACKKIAFSIRQKIDKSVNPCNNFYEFACGNFSRNAIISPVRPQINLMYQLRDAVLNQLKNNIENQITNKDPEAFHKLLAYYNTCMDEEKIENTNSTEFLEILMNFGGWPVLLGNAYDDSQFNWKDTVSKIGKMGYSPNLFLSMKILSDLKNNTRNILYLDQPIFTVSREYLSQGLKSDVVLAYFKYMIDVAEIFGADREQAALDLGKSLSFEIELARISLPESKRRHINKLYHPMKISELQCKYPSIPWLHYLNAQLSPYYELTEDETVIVMVPSFFECLGDLLARTPKRVLANYAVWRLVYDSVNQLDQRVRNAHSQFISAITGNRNNIPRWQTCILYASCHMHVASSALYVRRNFNKASKNGVIDMIKRLRQSFKNILLEVNWMDEGTRGVALEKLEQIIPLVGYFDESLDDAKLNDYYNDLHIYPKNYLATVLQYKRFIREKQLMKFRDPVPRVDWTIDEYAGDLVNAFYSFDKNTIYFPAGILQGDFYNEDYPKYVNYAAIGSVIGHEITHGFDDQGSAFDEKGNLVDWWDADSKKEYLRKTQCFVDQYSNFLDPQSGLHINGDLTQGENIADNGGLKEAYLAYLAYEKENGEEPSLPGFEEFSARQHFWISYGNIWCAKYRTEYLKNLITTDLHALDRFRLSGTVMNSPHFAKDFNCPAGSPMNPEKKCSIW